MFITIDGFSGSGKTTISEALETEFEDVRVIHADDFFYKRGTKVHPLSGNFDVERFIYEVIPQIYSGSGFFIRAYNCRTGKYYKKWIKKGSITILEGSYTSTKLLKKYVDLAVFLKSKKNDRQKRIKLREGNDYIYFVTKWFVDEYNFQRKFKTYKDCLKINSLSEIREIICGVKSLKTKNSHQN